MYYATGNWISDNEYDEQMSNNQWLASSFKRIGQVSWKNKRENI
jgi:hypothetical protein